MTEYTVESEVYCVADRYDENADPEWFEYHVRLCDNQGNLVSEWDSYFETYNGVQTLTKKDAEMAVSEIVEDVDEGDAGLWFDVAA